MGSVAKLNSFNGNKIFAKVREVNIQHNRCHEGNFRWTHGIVGLLVTVSEKKLPKILDM